MLHQASSYAPYWLLLSGGYARIRWSPVAIPLTTRLLAALEALPQDCMLASPEPAWWFRDWYFPSTHPGVGRLEGPAIVVPALEVQQHAPAHAWFQGPATWSKTRTHVMWSAIFPTYVHPWTTQDVPCQWFHDIMVQLTAAATSSPFTKDPYGHRQTR